MDDEITPDRIFALLRDGVIRDGAVSIPAPGKLKNLARHAELLRSAFKRQQAISWDAQRKLEGLLEEILRELPAVIQTNADMMKTYPGQQDMQGEALRDLESAARKVYDETGVGWKISPHVRDWTNFAVPLSIEFREAMQSTNPDVQIGSTPDGPLSRFMASIIPLITGETPNGFTVAAHIRREAERGNTTMAPVRA